jgi:hypothetical protein
LYPTTPPSVETFLTPQFVDTDQPASPDNARFYRIQVVQ